MKTILTAALALAAMTSAALADGAVDLTDAQMDKVTAGVGGKGAIYINGRASAAVPDTLKSDQRRLGDDVIDTTKSDRMGNPVVNTARVGNVLAVY